MHRRVTRLRFELVNRLAGALLRLIQRRADRLARMAQVKAILGWSFLGWLLPAGETPLGVEYVSVCTGAYGHSGLMSSMIVPPSHAGN